jgi:hypothetical protein
MRTGPTGPAINQTAGPLPNENNINLYAGLLDRDKYQHLFLSISRVFDPCLEPTGSVQIALLN